MFAKDTTKPAMFDGNSGFQDPPRYTTLGIFERKYAANTRVWMGGGGGYKCQLSFKISAICQLSVKF